MNKSTLIGFINKYFLAGVAEKVLITVKDNTISTVFVSEDGTLRGQVKTDNIGMTNSKVAVYETSGLLKLLTALDEEVTVKYRYQKPTIEGNYSEEVIESDSLESDDVLVSSLKISDGRVDVVFVLADPNVVTDPTNGGKIPIAKVPDNVDMTFNIDKEFRDSYRRSLTALPAAEKFIVDVEKDGTAVLILNYDVNNTNRIKFPLKSAVVSGSVVNKIRFNAKYLKQILDANYDAETGKIEIFDAGLMKISFTSSGGISTYYHVGVNMNKIKKVG